MAGTITTDLVNIDLADSATNWLSLGTWGAAFAATADIALQGTTDLWGRITANFAMALASVSSVDMTTGVHLFHFQKNITWPKTATKAEGGMRLCISSDTTPTLTGSNPSAGATNSKSWYMGGSDTDFTTGWVCYVVDPTSTPDLTLGSCTTTSIKRAGLGSYVTGTVGGGSVKPMNINISAIRYGYGLTVTDGTGSAPANFPAVYTTDSSSTYAWGIITAEGGIYYLAGKVNIGTTSQTALTVFRDTGQTLVYRNFPVSATFYEILVKGAASYKTTFRLGTYTPASRLASNGCTIRGSGTLSGTTHSIWILTASDSNQVSKFYASTFSEMKSAALAYNVVAPTVASCTTSNGSATMTTSGSFNTGGVVVGMSISGTNIPANTYVSSIESATSLTMNQNATGNIGGTATFSHNNEIRSCTFSNFGTITTNGCVIDNTIFQNLKTEAPISATYTLIVASTTEMGRITNCKFVNCNRAIKLTTAGSYTFTGNTFSSNSYDIENSSNATDIITQTDTRNTDQAVGNGTITAVGESFSGTGDQLANVVFTLSKTLTPTGSLYAKIYASTGSSGSYVPTGSALATSPAFNVGDLTTSPTETTIYFSTQNQNITLSAGTQNYVAVLEYSGGNATNYVNVGIDSTSPTFAGNLSTYTSPTWTAVGGSDAIFKVRTGGIVTITPASGSNPVTKINTGTPPGTVTINTGINLTIHCINSSQTNLSGIRVGVFQTSDLTTALLNTTTDLNGNAVVSLVLSAGTNLTLRARKSSTGSTRYQPYETTTTVPASDTTVTLVLTQDILVEL